MENNTVLEINNLRKKYGEKEVLKDVSINISKNQIYGLLGENGSGKTTLLKILANLTGSNGGKILFYNKHCRVGLVLDENGIYSQYSVWFNMEFFARLHGIYKKEYVKEFISLVNLDKYEKTLVNKLSKGLKRRLVLARALMIKPNLLLLDEPFDGLDIQSKNIIIECLQDWVKEDDNSAIFVSHNVDEIIELCGTVGIMKDGEIKFQGNSSDIERMKFKHLEIITHNVDAIVDILVNQKLKFEIEKDKIVITSDEEEANQIIESIQQKQISVSEIYKKFMSLKEIYLKIYE
ncbi:MAG: ABC transporter ATP-binding protein [Eubacterium sp.]|nr:ABC transporter ATP-binding protein [Eubacterium sp.]